jgi:hypothetical protein
MGGTPGPGGKNVRPQNVSGQITGAFMGASGGFVVYNDANGNGQLDIDPKTGASPDPIIGGNHDLKLMYLTGGGQLDYEKGRDKAGVLPTAGFNLLWDDGERWLPLNLVELKISKNEARLPWSVCSTYDWAANPTPGNVPRDEDGVGTIPDPGPYPTPGDPDLTCHPGGRSYSYGHCPPPPPPPPPGLCTEGSVNVTAPCAKAYRSLSPGQPVPPGWPCPVEEDGPKPEVDAGVPSDAGP